MTFYEREDLDRLKSRVSLSDYLTHSGVSLTRAGRHLRANCPLHDDSTPSFYVKNDDSFYCYGCQSGGDVFTLTQKLHDISFSEAVARVQAYAGGASAPTIQPRASTPAKPTELLASDQSLLEGVVAHYHQKLKKDSNAQDYLAKRKIANEVAEKFEIGIASGYLSRSFHRQAERLQELGLINQKNADTFYRRLTIPVRDSSGLVSQLYGRSLNQKNKHRYLPIAHQTIFHPDALSESKVILCESILDALTFHSHGIEHAVAVYSAGGLKPDFVSQLTTSSVRKVMIAYDADTAGDQGAANAAERLRPRGIRSYRLRLRKGMDVNAVAVESDKPVDTLERLIKASRNNLM